MCHQNHLCSLLKHTPDCILHPGYTVLMVLFSFFLSVQDVLILGRRWASRKGLSELVSDSWQSQWLLACVRNSSRCVLSRHGLSNVMDLWVDLWMFRLANLVKSILDREAKSYKFPHLYLWLFSSGVPNLRVSWRTIFIIKVVSLCNEIFFRQPFSVTTSLCTFDRSNINKHSSVFHRPSVPQALPLSSSNCIILSGQFSIYAIFMLFFPP